MPPELRSDAGADLAAYGPAAGQGLGGQVRSRWRAFSARHPIGVFLLKRTLAGIATLFVASFLVFLATNALPGNVAETVLGKNATPKTIAHLEGALGLDRPLLSQYFSWLGGVLHGDLGNSAVAVARGSNPASINSIIGTPLLNSFILGALATLILVPLSLLIGVYTGVRAGKRADHVVSTITLLLGSLPEFVLGTFLVVIFFTQLDLLPPVALAAGQSPLAEPAALVLPIATLLGVSLAFCVPAGPGGHDRGRPPGLRHLRPAQRPAGAEGDEALRVAQRPGPERPDLRPGDPVPDRAASSSSKPSSPIRGSAAPGQRRLDQGRDRGPGDRPRPGGDLHR